MKYYLKYDYGFHHIWIEVTKESFDSVIDDLSSEFTIYKEESSEETYGYSSYTETYSIINYHDEQYTVGYRAEVKLTDYDQDV